MSALEYSPRFRPLPLLGNRHLQTVLGNRLWPGRQPASTTCLVPLPDHDRLALEVSTPPAWRDGSPVAVLVHGLCGDHRSTYMVRITARLLAAGARVVRMNLRGNGSGAGLARRPYHAGCSDDLRAALEAVMADAPRSPVRVVGFSLGGNVVLKLAGELGGAAPARLAGVVAVCPPADLYASWQHMSRPGGRPYQRLFVGWLREEMQRRHRLWCEPVPELPEGLDLFGFDDHYTAPRVGYAGAREYYADASALPLLGRIELPCRVLVAEDDPVVSPAWLEQAALPPAARVLRSAAGGHLGFLGLPGPRFMDDLVRGWALGEP